MHHFEHEGTHFNYNSDLSGDVLIRHGDGPEVPVNGDALLMFVAEYVRGRRIGALEQMEPLGVLGI